MRKRDHFYLASGILSLHLFPERAGEISERFPQTETDWQKWVQMGSNHLVLPALYLSLRRNDLLSLLPRELAESLEHIHDLNLERNQSILRQCRQLNRMLVKEGIEPVFLKGAGNILDGLYNDPGERMMYDIDILLEDKHMLPAAQLLLDSGCKTRKRFDPKAYSSTMHYPILLREDWTAGVEIHRLPVQYHYLKAFGPEVVFETKREAHLEKGFFVMSDRNKIVHNFMHSQLMHNGHYHADVSLRDLYDLLLLGRRENLHAVLGEFKPYRLKSDAYLCLMHRAFDIPWPDKEYRKSSHWLFMARQRLILSLGPRSLKTWHVLILLVSKYLVLPVRTLFDRNARNYVFSRLGNPHWYGEHLRAWRRRGSSNE